MEFENIKFTSEMQKQIVKRLRDSEEKTESGVIVPAGQYGSKFFKSCQTLVRKYPAIFIIRAFKRKHSFNEYETVYEYFIEMKKPVNLPRTK